MNFREKYGPWALVTGASSGIGRAMALEIARRGLNVALASRGIDALEEVALECRRLGVECLVLPIDFSDSDASEALDKRTQHLDIGLVMLSAGFGTSGPFLESDLSSEVDMLRVNVEATLTLSHRFGQRLVGRGKGGLVLMGSLVGLQGTPWSANYSATKAYVQTLSEALHVELKPKGVDVLSCSPGPVNSGFADRAGMSMASAEKPAVVAKQTLGALGKRVTVYPGLLSKLLTFSLAPLPRPIRSLVMSRVMGKMAGVHQ